MLEEGELTLELAGTEYTPDISVYPKLPTDWRSRPDPQG